MDNENAKKIFFSGDKNIRNLGLEYLLAKRIDSTDIIKIWFDSVKHSYKKADTDIRKLFVFFNFSNKNVIENFKILIDFYSSLENCNYREDFFFLIYMSSIEIQKYYIKDLKMILSEDEYKIIENNFKEYESFKNYKIDELFLYLINLLNDSDELNFMDLNHRLIETIIDMIVKFPNGEIIAFIENIISEKINNYYLNSYLFYINAQLDGFINGDDLIDILISKFNVIKFEILEEAFFVRPSKRTIYKLIKKDFEYILLLKYFSSKEIIDFYYELSKDYDKKELFLEYFTKLFSLTLTKEGVALSKKWIKENLVRNKEIIKLLNLSVVVLKLL